MLYFSGKFQFSPPHTLGLSELAGGPVMTVHRSKGDKRTLVLEALVSSLPVHRDLENANTHVITISEYLIIVPWTSIRTIVDFLLWYFGFCDTFTPVNDLWWCAYYKGWWRRSFRWKSHAEWSTSEVEPLSSYTYLPIWQFHTTYVCMFANKRFSNVHYIWMLKNTSSIIMIYVSSLIFYC